MARGAESVHCPIQAPQSYVEPYMHLDPNRRTFAGMLAALDEAVRAPPLFRWRRNGVGQRSQEGALGGRWGRWSRGLRRRRCGRPRSPSSPRTTVGDLRIAALFHSQAAVLCLQTLSSAAMRKVVLRTEWCCVQAGRWVAGTARTPPASAAPREPRTTHCAAGRAPTTRAACEVSTAC